MSAYDRLQAFGEQTCIFHSQSRLGGNGGFQLPSLDRLIAWEKYLPDDYTQGIPQQGREYCHACSSRSKILISNHKREEWLAHSIAMSLAIRFFQQFFQKSRDIRYSPSTRHLEPFQIHTPLHCKSILI